MLTNSTTPTQAREPNGNAATSSQIVRAKLLRSYRAAADERDRGRDYGRRRAADAQLQRLAGELSPCGVGVQRRLPRPRAGHPVHRRLLDDLRADQGRGPVPLRLLFRGPHPRSTGRPPTTANTDLPAPAAPRARGRTRSPCADTPRRIPPLGDARYARALRKRRLVFDRFYACQHFEDARVVPDEHHRPCGVLPKGKRTRGHRIDSLDQVYIR